VPLDYSCDWVVLVKRKEDAGELNGNPEWRGLVSPRPRRPWTDDFSNVFRVIRW
jgi:hypothetical protein